MSAAPPFTQHPMLPALGLEHIQQFAGAHACSAAEAWQRIEHKRRETVRLAKEDPFRHGFELEWWHDADGLFEAEETRLLAALGGNGPGKTTWMIKRGLQKAFTIPRAKVLFLHEDDRASIDVHQAIAYDLLPTELRPRGTWKPKKTVTTNIGYEAKNGFTDSVFTTPVGGKVLFGNYQQALKRWEGGGWTFIGADENLPLGWLNTLLLRLGREGGKMIWSFTCIDGMTPALDEVTRNAVTEQSRPVDERLLPKDHRVSQEQDWPAGHMPYIAQATRPEVKIIYAHAAMNPLSGYDPTATPPRGAYYGYEDLVKVIRGRSVVERERRGYGWARKTKGSAFPRFGARHVVPHERMMAQLAKLPVTRYQVIDPAGARNFFTIWFAVDEHGRHFIYREWPDVETYGDWAEPSDDARKWNGKPGPAQDSLGMSVEEYKKLFLELEGWQWREGVWEPFKLQTNAAGEEKIAFEGSEGRQGAAEEIFERYIDPRSGATEAMASAEGESSLIDRFLDDQTDGEGKIIGPSMPLEPAHSGRDEEDGMTQINALLAYDLEKPIVALLNEPKLYVSDRCKNVIWALAHYAKRPGGGVKDEACKDPVDVVRYMALKNCTYVQASALQGFAGGGWR